MPSRRSAQKPAPSGPKSVRSGALPSLVGFVLAAGLAGAFAYGAGCSGNGEAEGETSSPSRVSAVGATATDSGADPAAPPPPSARPSASVATAPTPPSKPPADAPYDGPYLGAMALSTPVYPEPRFGDERMGYIRQGGKVPVDPTPIKRANCKQGWFKLVDGGYVCGKYATTNLEHERVKLGVRQPDRKATVPYQYAYNRFHGTPLYKALPSREEMQRVEPHLLELDKPKEPSEASASASASASVPEAERKGAKHVPKSEADGNVPSGDDAAKAAVAAVEKLPSSEGDVAEAPLPEPSKPWWQSDEKKPEVSLSDLEKDASGALSKRMVKGFFIAIDKTLGWNERSFYRTTGGLIAPADRMVVNKPPETRGIDWPADAKEIFFVLSDKASKFEPTKDDKGMKEKGKLARFAAVPLNGTTREISGTIYRQAVDGSWVKGAQGTTTAPGRRPSEVGENEKWVDVNLEKKTLVLFVGDKPVYAALISPGKKSRNKKKNHATPTGAFRVREKHVAVTMDGDGASGDLPYSIEDVPYVAYFKGSYALHAAFWHNNFGREMSHGCVNLAPHDAKVVFEFVDPIIPRGWHGVFASSDRPGSLVVLHE